MRVLATCPSTRSLRTWRSSWTGAGEASAGQLVQAVCWGCSGRLAVCKGVLLVLHHLQKPWASLTADSPASSPTFPAKHTYPCPWLQMSAPPRPPTLPLIHPGLPNTYVSTHPTPTHIHKHTHPLSLVPPPTLITLSHTVRRPSTPWAPWQLTSPPHTTTSPRPLVQPPSAAWAPPCCAM